MNAKLGIASSTRSPKLAEAFLYLANAAVFVLLVYITFRQSLHTSGDTGLYLEGARKIIEGAVPYIDFIDINPPLVMYLHVPIVWFAGQIDVDSVAVFFWTIATLTYVAMVVTFNFAKIILPEEAGLLAFFIAASLAVATFNFEASWFGQREHMFALVIFPYLLLRMARYEGVNIRVAVSLSIGLAAAVLGSLKPQYFFPTLIIVELFLLLKHRVINHLITLETVTVALFVIAYVVIFALLGGESYTLFIDVYVPLIVESYDVMNAPDGTTVKGVMQSMGPELAALVISWGLLRALSNNVITRDIADMVLLMGFMGLASYVSQGKGFGYHELPLRFMAVVMVCMLLGCLANKVAGRWHSLISPKTPILMLSLLFGLMLVMASQNLVAERKFRVQQSVMQIILNMTEPGDRIALFGVPPHWAYPMIQQSGRKTGTRYSFTFVPPLLYERSEPNANEPHGYTVSPDRIESEGRYIKNIQADFLGDQPEYILFNRKDCYGCQEGMNMEAYILGQPGDFPFIKDYDRVFSSEWFLLFGRR